jgi:hypothetical protein
MGQGFRAVFPVVVIGIVADLLMELLLGLKVVGFVIRGLGVWLGGGLGSHRSSGEGSHSEATGEDSLVATAPIADACVQPLPFPFRQLQVLVCTAAAAIEGLGIAPLAQKPRMDLVDGLGFKGDQQQGR